MFWDDDLPGFFNPDEFGVEAVFNGDIPITVIKVIKTGQATLYGNPTPDQTFEIRAQATDIEDNEIDADATVEINGVTYNVDYLYADAFGTVTLSLSKA